MRREPQLCVSCVWPLHCMQTPGSWASPWVGFPRMPSLCSCLTFTHSKSTLASHGDAWADPVSAADRGPWVLFSVVISIFCCAHDAMLLVTSTSNYDMQGQRELGSSETPAPRVAQPVSRRTARPIMANSSINARRAPARLESVRIQGRSWGSLTPVLCSGTENPRVCRPDPLQSAHTSRCCDERPPAFARARMHSKRLRLHAAKRSEPMRSGRANALK
jgi:hypothetical protein